MRDRRESWDEDGSLVLKASLPAEIGALVLKALDAAMPSAAAGNLAEAVGAALKYRAHALRDALVKVKRVINDHSY